MVGCAAQLTTVIHGVEGHSVRLLTPRDRSASRLSRDAFGLFSLILDRELDSCALARVDWTDSTAGRTQLRVEVASAASFLRHFQLAWLGVVLTVRKLLSPHADVVGHTGQVVSHGHHLRRDLLCAFPLLWSFKLLARSTPRRNWRLLVRLAASISRCRKRTVI